MLRIWATTLTPLLLAAISNAQTYTWDQQQTATNGAFTVPTNQPLGQSFTPFVGAMNAVELRMADVNTSNGTGASFAVRIYQGTGGPVLATSNTVTLPNGFDGFPVFTLPGALPLTPGQLYSLELIYTSATEAFNVGAVDNPNLYGFGTAIANGMILDNFDLYFRQGIVTPVPEPASMLGLAGALGGAAWARRRYTKSKVLE